MTEIREAVVDELVDALLRGERALQHEVSAAFDRCAPTADECAVVRQRVNGRHWEADGADPADLASGTDDADVIDHTDLALAAGALDVAPDRFDADGTGAVLDVSRRLLWTLAQVYDVARRWWLPPPADDRRTLGDLLKVIPIEEAHQITGYLVWGGLLAPPDGGLAVPTIDTTDEEGA